MKFCDERIQKHLLNGGKIKRESCDFFIFLNNKGFLCYQSEYNVNTCCINKNDLIADDWETVETEYDWNKIIKDKVLCVFGGCENSYYIIGYLQEINSEGKFELLGGLEYNYCEPFNPENFNMAKDLKEYEK